MIQFDEHIFQMGWFNHQLVDLVSVAAQVRVEHEDLLCYKSQRRDQLLGEPKVVFFCFEKTAKVV